MAKGISLHLGLNTYDPGHYPGAPVLHGAERDAIAMQELARSRHYQTTMLQSAQATFDAVRTHIADAAHALVAGDTFLLTFSGHGATVDDTNGDEPSGQDQTLCLYDREIVDDLLYQDLGAFAAGVRIVMVADSCHSGSVARLRGRGTARGLSRELAARVYRAHKELYDAQQTPANRASASAAHAPILLLAACQDDQEAVDTLFHGRFTGALLDVWNGGAFLDGPSPTYRALLDAVTKAIADPTQVPNLFQAGAPDPAFASRAPFVI